MILYTVVPCYNEEDALPETVRILSDKYFTLMRKGMISEESRILLVDDGSSDDTWNMIREYHDKKPIFCGLKLSRNRGHQNALYAGLMAAAPHCDAAISIDADLQDDLAAMDEMMKHFSDGCDVVYGVRSKREKDSFLKRFTAEGYYKVIAAMGGEVVFNHADYRLLSRRAMQALMTYPERDLFLRGMVPMLGFKTARVEYERGVRNAGESKYTLKKMLTLALDGVISLSSRPIRFISGLGTLLLCAALVTLIVFACTGVSAAAVAAVSAWGAAGLVLTALGVLGEYIGHIYDEVKARPRYFIMDILE